MTRFSYLTERQMHPLCGQVCRHCKRTGQISKKNFKADEFFISKVGILIKPTLKLPSPCWYSATFFYRRLCFTSQLTIYRKVIPISYQGNNSGPHVPATKILSSQIGIYATKSGRRSHPFAVHSQLYKVA